MVAMQSCGAFLFKYVTYGDDHLMLIKIFQPFLPHFLLAFFLGSSLLLAF